MMDDLIKALTKLAMPLAIGSSHNDRILNPDYLRRFVLATRRQIKELQTKTKIDALVCSGHSGAGVSFPLSYSLRIPVWIVRKEGEKTHSGVVVERAGKFHGIPLLNYVIVDDLIDSGATIRRILNAMDVISTPTAFCKGIFLFNDNGCLFDSLEFQHKGKHIPIYRSYHPWRNE